MKPSRNYLLPFLVLLLLLPVLGQEKADDPLENFDGSKAESTEVDPEAKPSDNPEDPGSGKISLGELSKDAIKEDKVAESLENELESANAKGDKIDERIKAAIEQSKPALSASGLELNKAEVFPADI